MSIQGLTVVPQELFEERPRRRVNIEACRRGGQARAAQASFKEACRQGGLARAAQPSFIVACQKGFAATCEKHPDMALWLAKRIHGMNEAKGAELGMSAREYRAMRIEQTGACGMRSLDSFA